jgi:EAL domain-containing protein (putative c-di-GMP-specific phosphodiesterase class I)/GGDEF domain-containing protein
LISVLFLMIFSVNFVAGVSNIRGYLQVEAKVHVQDTATSLALSLSPHMGDPHDPILKADIQAIFDMGYYREIKLTDAAGKTLVALSDGKGFEEVPGWFIALLPMDTATAQSAINAEWSIAGTVYVAGSPGYAYLKLYQQARSAFYYSLVVFGVSIALLFLVLHCILQPLNTIDQLAKAIAAGNFARIEKLPWTTEVRDVANSMNLMSKKIEGVINNLHQKLETLSRQLLLDDLTGLYKKGCFETDIKQLFMANGDGFIFSLKIDNLAELTKDQGNDAADRFLRHFAEILIRCAHEQQPEPAKVYRFYSSEFAILAKAMPPSAVEPFAKLLQTKLTHLGEQYHKKDIVHIGVAPFNPIGTTAGILAAANEAYEQAKLIGTNSYFIRQSDEQGKTVEQWKNLLFDIIDGERYQVSYIGQAEDLHSGEIIMEEAFTQAFDEQGRTIPIGTFVSLAEKFEKIVDLDKGVTQRVVEHIDAGQLTHGIVINLSMATLKNADFRFWLIDFLRQHAFIAGQLVFSVTAYAAAKDIALVQDFIAFVHKQGAKVLLKRYEAQFIPIEAVKNLKPDYIRLARELTSGISAENSKKIFVEAMKEVGELLDIVILAENVHSAGDFDIIREIGLSGSSR